MRSNKPGFSLIELVIYIGVLSMVVTSVILMVSEVFKMQAKIRGAFVLQDNLDFAGKRLVFAVEHGCDIAAPASGSSTALRVTQSADAGDVVDFALADGRVTMSVKGEAAVPITSPEVFISGLNFERIQAAAPTVRFMISGRLRQAESFLQVSDQTMGVAEIKR